MYAFGVILYMMFSGGEEPEKVFHDSSMESMSHRHPPKLSELHAKIKSAQTNPSEKWAAEEVGGADLILKLIHKKPRLRLTASDAKEHVFFPQHLGQPVENLMIDEGPFGPPPQGAETTSSTNGPH